MRSKLYGFKPLTSLQWIARLFSYLSHGPIISAQSSLKNLGSLMPTLFLRASKSFIQILLSSTMPTEVRNSRTCSLLQFSIALSRVVEHIQHCEQALYRPANWDLASFLLAEICRNKPLHSPFSSLQFTAILASKEAVTASTSFSDCIVVPLPSFLTRAY